MWTQQPGELLYRQCLARSDSHRLTEAFEQQTVCVSQADAHSRADRFNAAVYQPRREVQRCANPGNIGSRRVDSRPTMIEQIDMQGIRSQQVHSAIQPAEYREVSAQGSDGAQRRIVDAHCNEITSLVQQVSDLKAKTGVPTF